MSLWVIDAARMKPIEFEIQRTIRAPIDEVFARLVNINGHNDWMAGTGSMLKHTRQTSPGEPTIGTTFVDETSQGAMPGEITEMERPHTIVFHWWEKSKSGKLKFEGWPSTTCSPSATRRPWSATAASCCPTGCGAWAHRSGDDSPSRSGPSQSTRSRRPSSGPQARIWLNTLLVVPCSGVTHHRPPDRGMGGRFQRDEQARRCPVCGLDRDGYLADDRRKCR